jgi:HTH domain
MVSARHPLLRALEPVAESLGAELVGPKHVRVGDIPLEWEGVIVGGLRLPGMQGSLERMMVAVEQELGAPFARMSREQKQLAVRMLDDRGAFALRRSVESVADAMAVSRFTIYNYLNAAG